MCGRYTLTRPPREVAELLDLPEVPLFEARYNIAPTQQVMAARQGEGGREGVWLRWGLVPSWATDLSVGSRMLNARSETILEKATFRKPFLSRRCLIPADGFYEWRKVGKQKLPVHFRFRDGRVFAMAGLWESWTGPDGVVQTCCVLTTAGNELVGELHDRMPVILAPERFAAWLDPHNADIETLQSWLVPYDVGEMAAVPANPFVNNARHEGPQCWAVA